MSVIIFVLTRQDFGDGGGPIPLDKFCKKSISPV